MGLDQTLYGSSRLGQEQIGEIIASSDLNLVNINTATQNIIGDKYFEMSNHLGNVLEVVSDRKLPVNDGNGNIDYFLADVVSYSDYYPFGVQMPGRNGSTGDYRYGFNGMEKDDEVKGSGNSYDFGARMHDPRVGRFLSRDPKESNYPWQSTYVYAANSPIYLVDENGEGPITWIIRSQTAVKKFIAKITGTTVKTKLSAQFAAGIPSLGVGGKGEIGVAVDPKGNIGFYGSGDLFADATLFNDNAFTGQSVSQDGAFSLLGSVSVTGGISFSGKTNVTDIAGSSLGTVGLEVTSVNLKGAVGLAGGISVGEDEVGLEAGIGIGVGLSNISSNTFVFATTIGDINKLENNYNKANKLAYKKGVDVEYSASQNDGWITMTAIVSYANKRGKEIKREFELVTLKGSDTKNLIQTKGVKD